jgi:Fur family transcriptional regulator, ferric uptake regulator
MTGKEIAADLKRRGYKLTPQRKAIIAILSGSNEHLTPAGIHARLKDENPGIGLVTVYRTLELLQESGLLCEVHIGDSCRSYLNKGSGGHHHHLVCSSCGTVVDFNGCNLDELQRRLCAETGFKIEKHLLEFMGCCRSCLEKGKC